MLIKQHVKYLNKFQFLCLRRISGVNLWDKELTPSIKHKIEEYWKTRINKTINNENQEKYYVLSMFPYPSGHLHMGHVRVYTISDSIARYQRMNGKNVIHPIGWDAFGLPAENAAIEHDVLPEVWTNHNIQSMKNQLMQLGCSFDWNREVTTCNPDYYKWTQDLFLKLYEAGLVYQKKALVNWDPIDKTVLADEQVDENGNAWRSGAKVIKKYLKQWFVKTTRFAKDLYDGLDDPILQDWRDIIKLQKHWIGECNGVTFDFKILENDNFSTEFINIWTDKPEYLNDAKFIIVNTNNIYADNDGHAMDNNIRKLNIMAQNPITNERIPIFLSNAFDNGLDHHLGIPGICEHDEIFARKYGVKFEKINNLTPSEIIKKRNEICNEAKINNSGGYWKSAKLKDWLISRQRYWGTPIPIIHCQACGPQPVLADDLPVVLPKMCRSVNKGIMSLTESHDWLSTHCPKCKGPATRDTDTLDTFVDSSWYYLRYLDPKNDKEMFNSKNIKSLTPVDLYIGGKEHATLHLYYARFINYFLHSLGLVPTKEPFKRLLVQGMVMGRSYKIKRSGKYVPENEVEVLDLKKNKALHKISKEPVLISWEKMSKSKYNGANPTDMFENYGIDTTRLLIMADVAPTSHRNWNSNTFPGVINWQRRLWLTIQSFIENRKSMPKTIPENKFKDEDYYMFDSRNYYIKGATFNYCLSQQMSVALSKMQGLTNSLRKVSPTTIARSPQYERALATQIILLAPMAPHFASELWSGFLLAENRINNSSEIDWNKSVLEQRWPEVDFNYELELICQVNGSDNGAIKFSRKEIELLSSEEALKIALQQKSVQELLKTRTIVDVKYTIYHGYENVLNILTTQPPQKTKQEICNEN